MHQEFYSNGKLLLAGEYVVLDGGLGLAIPTKYGQSLSVVENDSQQLLWQSFDHSENIWFEGCFGLPRLTEINSTNTKIASLLNQILREAQKLNPDFLASKKGCFVETQLSFPRDWGLGSSSTLINNIAQWAKIDAHQLLWNTMGGSGYDISCAQHDHPITYQLKDGLPHVQEIPFDPPFADALYFIHLNQKQDSRQAIKKYSDQVNDQKKMVSEISNIVMKMINATQLSEFESAMLLHEDMLSKVLKLQAVQSRLFSDYFGKIKSLGGWGGDFILATGNEKTPEYFKSKGFCTILSFDKMVR